MDLVALISGAAAAAMLLVAVRVAGVGDQRGTYAVVLGAVAAFYLVFAIEVGGTALIAWHAVVAAGFAGVAVLGARTTMWWIVGGLAAHGLFDLAEGVMAPNPAPEWWPAFCLGFDLAIAAGLARMLVLDRFEPRATPSR